MARDVLVRRIESTDWETYRALRLESLRESLDSFGSLWSLEAQDSDARWRERTEQNTDTTHNCGLLAFEREEAIGLAWGRIEPSDRSRADLYQMWVAPHARRVG